MVGYALPFRTAARLNMRDKLLNFVGFQIGWFACVLGGANGMPWLGPLVALPVLAWHLLHAAAPAEALKLLILAAIVGSLFDQTLLSFGWIQYPAAGWPAWLLPLWMTTLWALFASTLNVSLRWLHGRTVLAIVFGLTGGPLAYLGGQALGALVLVEATPALLALAVGWALMMLVLLRLASVFDGYQLDTAGSTRQKEA